MKEWLLVERVHSQKDFSREKLEALSTNSVNTALLISTTAISELQKHPSRGVLRKRCSENMQQIYRRTHMPKCDFNKVAKDLFISVS